MPDQAVDKKRVILHPKAGPTPPPRFARPGILSFLLYVILVAFFIFSLKGAKVSPWEFVKGWPYLLELIQEMFPPSLERLDRIGISLLETFQMALVGTVFGVLFSLVLAVMATRKHSPSKILYFGSRAFIALFRTVPDLIWALIFVVAVGLGPFAGTLAIMVDTMGFCGRFFAEAMEEVDAGPQEALTALGATRIGTIFSAVFPGAMPSFINTSLFSLEKATRSSVVLGLVGAGGIGIELKVSMDMFQYAEASMIMICIFLLVLMVERASSVLRQRII